MRSIEPGSSNFRVRFAPRNDGELAGPDQRHRLVALVQIKQTPQRLAALALELRIVFQNAQSLIARLRDQLAVDLGARDAIAGQAALADAEHVAFAAQLQILLGNPKAVSGLADHVETGLRHLAERLLVEQQAGRGFGAAADPAAELMQLR